MVKRVETWVAEAVRRERLKEPVFSGSRDKSSITAEKVKELMEQAFSNVTRLIGKVASGTHRNLKKTFGKSILAKKEEEVPQVNELIIHLSQSDFDSGMSDDDSFDEE